MKTYAEATPVITLMNNDLDFDFVNSSYTNIRFTVAIGQSIVVTAQYEANLPGLAYDYYGNVEYWRAILYFNGLQDPVDDVQVGMTLDLPDATSLQAYLTNASSQASTTTKLSI